MKMNSLPMRWTLLLLCGLLPLLQGCLRDRCDQTFTHLQYEPTYMSRSDFESSVQLTGARELTEPGKIFVNGSYLYVIETAKGLHIINNEDPSNPQKVGFLQVPGIYDLTISCEQLIVDSSTDLLVFDLTTPEQPIFQNRIRNAMPHILTYRGYEADPNEGIVIEWKATLTEGEYDCQTGIPALWQMNEPDEETMADMNLGSSRTANPATPGKAGSMSRFALLNEHLYIVAPTELYTYSVSGCAQPSLVSQQNIDTWGGEAEMVSTLDNLLLVGSSQGMFIYDASTPEQPQMLSMFEHAQACDPVVASGDYAYVTLRDGRETNCGGGFTNQLDVVNISDPSFPFLVTSFPMTNPHGLALDGDLLFIADGDDGLKIFDNSNPERVGLSQLAHFRAFQGYDVIPQAGVLIMTGNRGLALYDYSNINAISQISSIAIGE